MLATPPPCMTPQQDRLAGRTHVETMTRADPVGHMHVAAPRLDHEQSDRVLAIGDRQVSSGAAGIGQPGECRGGA